MTGKNTGIKVFGIIMAVLLIILMICTAIFLITRVVMFFSDDDYIGEMQTYDLNQNITNIELEISAANVKVTEGDKFSLETNLKNVKVKDENGNLIIEDKTKKYGSRFDEIVFNVTIPKGTVFDHIDIKTGAGQLYVEKMTGKVVRMKLGAGKVNFDELNVITDAEIQGGTGEMTVKNGEITNLTLDMGVGELNLTSRLKGSSKFELGVGSTTVKLLGKKDNYCINVDKGIGDAVIDGESVKNGEYGNGESLIKVKVGVGSFRASFIEAE